MPTQLEWDLRIIGYHAECTTPILYDGKVVECLWKSPRYVMKGLAEHDLNEHFFNTHAAEPPETLIGYVLEDTVFNKPISFVDMSKKG